MSLNLVWGEDFPRRAWMLDDVTPFKDQSGYEVNATCASTSFGPALVKGATRSLVVGNTSKVSYSAPIFVKGKEYLAFAVEAFVRPVISDPTNITEQQIFGNDGFMDGLTIKGTVVSFVTKYSATGEARASFDLIDLQAVGAVGVHTETKNQLYINGEMVAEVDITPFQQADTYAAPGTSLSSGASASTNSLLMNAVSVYQGELDDESIITHYANAQDTLGAEDVAIDYRGALLEFAPDGALAPFYSIEYSSNEEWSLGTLNNAAIHDGTLYPLFSNLTSQAGYWQTVVPLGTSPATIYAANLIWEGTGAVVSTSRDGALWVTARKGVALTTIPKGTNGAGEFLFIRVEFPGGMVNDPSYFDNMVFSLYGTGVIPATSFVGREVILDKATPESDMDVIDYHQNWGVEMEAGTITIKAGGASSSIIPKTIEVWAMKGGATFSDNMVSASPTRWKSNGGAQKSYALGEWQLRHYVFDAGFTGDIVFSGTGQIGHVVLYPDALSDATISEIYQSYTGKPKITLDVDETFDIHEFNGAVDIYEYNWAIESAG